MNRRSQADEDTVTVHVTPRGSLYVKPAELLRSQAAREMMTKMGRVLGTEGRTPASPDTYRSSAQRPSRER